MINESNNFNQRVLDPSVKHTCVPTNICLHNTQYRSISSGSGSASATGNSEFLLNCCYWKLATDSVRVEWRVVIFIERIIASRHSL